MKILEMKNCNMILIEKPQKIPALSYSKIDKHEFLRSEEILSDLTLLIRVE